MLYCLVRLCSLGEILFIYHFCFTVLFSFAVLERIFSYTISAFGASTKSSPCVVYVRSPIRTLDLTRAELSDNACFAAHMPAPDDVLLQSAQPGDAT